MTSEELTTVFKMHTVGQTTFTRRMAILMADWFNDTPKGITLQAGIGKAHPGRKLGLVLREWRDHGRSRSGSSGGAALSTIFDKEMQAALEADGEYLRQMTGEDHGPFFLDDDEGDCDFEPDDLDCYHEGYDADILTGEAWCWRCQHKWNMTHEEIAREIEHQAEYMAEFECEEAPNG